MGSPIVSNDFVIANLSGDLCGEFQKMLSVADKMRVWFAWAFDDYGNATEEFKALFVSIGVPIGGVLWYPTQIIPAGWLLCNGQAVSRTTYASLFAVIGTSSGVGDGSTTFNVPNLEGKFLFGSSSSHGVGEAGGEETHELTEAELATHSHPTKNGKDFISHPNDPLDASTWNTRGEDVVVLSGLNPTTGDAGSGTAHNNMPPYKTGLWLIKY